MKKNLLILVCLWAIPASASHIVGGEFEIAHLVDNRYRIQLVLYFDELNGDTGARDRSVQARIFRKRDDVLMMDVFLPFLDDEPVSYTQPSCSNGEIVTSRILYSTIVTLSPQQFSDAQGYYLVWERCCRNYSITNVYSNDPATGGQYAGQTFYLEFPPVVRDGQAFINSSPRLFPPLNDYACPRRPYYVDFAGIDDDGDSLTYSIVTPLNTKSPEALPLPDLRPGPRPYPQVTYRPPFSATNIIGGAPDLHITQDGFLTVTPTNLGLYVFAVRCEEFRDGVKIGEVRRDFQMLVVDGCNPAVAPRIVGRKLTDDEFDDELNVSFSNTVADTERCIQVQVSDEDALRAIDNFTEQITIRAIPLNFKQDISGILPAVTSETLRNGSTRTFDICFDRCPFLENGPFQIGIVAYDDACSLPLTDTLRVTVNVEPPDNTDAYFTTPNVTEFVFEGTQKSWPIAAKDDDMDSLVISVMTDDFNLADVGMEIQQVQQSDGSYQASLVWNAFCDVYDFSQRKSFDVTLLVDDADGCNFNDPDIMEFHLSIQLTGNTSPVIGTDLTSEELEQGVTREVFQSLNFDVFGDDKDNDPLKLAVQGVGFDLATYGMNFEETTGQGHVSSPFVWDILCDKVDLAKKDTFDFLFILIDDVNKCRLYDADTLAVRVKVAPPDNTAPVLTITSTNRDLPFANNQQTLTVGQEISLGINSADADKAPQDHLVLEMISAEGSVEPSGYIFEPAEGFGNVQSTFVWNTDCSIFEDGVYENFYKFTFRTYDDRCDLSKADTLSVELTIKDIENDIAAFMPPNFVSPDGDPQASNEFFAMVRLNESGELVDIMPKDNCVGHFVGVSIYNRWGKQVFESSSRDFRWYPNEDASGVYFYTLIFSDKEFKGSITVRN